jgi:glycosyltransferase involved in cell wall biosynthesis
VLCAANFRYEKGHRFLIEAVGLLRGRNVELRLLLAGDGPLRGAVAEQVREAGLDDVVSFLGSVPHDDLLALMSRAYVVVLSSTHEGLPVSAMEALAIGTPPVATQVGGLLELVEDGLSGLLVAPSRPIELADAIGRLLDDAALRASISEGGRERIRAWDIEDVAARHEEIYAAAAQLGTNR